MSKIAEEWRDIEQFKGEYQISNFGRIRNYRTKKVLKNYISPEGYVCNSLRHSKEERTHTVRVHRLIAEAFIPNPNNYPIINHIDGNKHNNSLENLEWCTGSENVQHAYDTGLAHEHHLEYTKELRYKLGKGWRGKHRSEEEKEKRREAMLGRKYDDSVSQKHKNYSATKSKEYWSEYFKNIPRKTKKVKNLITGVTYNSVKEAREKENITIAIMSRKLKEGKEYIYVD